MPSTGDASFLPLNIGPSVPSLNYYLRGWRCTYILKSHFAHPHGQSVQPLVQETKDEGTDMVWCNSPAFPWQSSNDTPKMSHQFSCLPSTFMSPTICPHFHPSTIYTSLSLRQVHSPQPLASSQCSQPSYCPPTHPAMLSPTSHPTFSYLTLHLLCHQCLITHLNPI